jgi:DNA-directed RNA polymerase specialized sigma24 family protein
MNENSYSVYEALKALSTEGKKQEKALEWLYRFQVPAFKRYLIFKGLSQSQSEDVTQIVIIKVFEHADEFRGNEDLSEASAKSWLWKIVRTSLIDFIRREQKHKPEITGLNLESDLSDLDKVALAEDEHPEAAIKPVTDDFEQLAIHPRSGKSIPPDIKGEFYLQENKTTQLPVKNTDLLSDHFYHQSSELFETNDNERNLDLQNSSFSNRDLPHATRNKLSQTKEQFKIEKEERKRQILIEDCVRRGIEEFSANEPDRADALLMQIDGAPIKRIAQFIKRTEGATKEYLSQTRKKIGPYISTCFELLDHNSELLEPN